MSDLPHALEPALSAPLEKLDTRAAGRLAYYSDPGPPGSEDRPALLLLHSINAAPSAMEIKPLFEHYRASRGVFAPDLPGFGLSERADIAYNPDLYADTLLELAEAVKPSPLHVVALSTTAEFAARAALAAPERFASLTLVSPTGLGSRQPPSDRTRDRIYRFFNLPGVGRGLYRLLTTRISVSYFLGMAFVGDTPDELIDYAVSTTRQPGARFAPFCFLSGKLFTARAWETLYARLEVPTLILYDEDPNVGFDNLPELLARNTRIRAHRIAPTLGLPHWEKPAETHAVLDQFWSATPSL